MTELHLSGRLCSNTEDLILLKVRSKGCSSKKNYGHPITSINEFVEEQGLLAQSRGYCKTFINNCNLQVCFKDVQYKLKDAMLSMGIFTNKDCNEYSPYSIVDIRLYEDELVNEFKKYYGEHCCITIKC